jgi:hypothetical protein
VRALEGVIAEQDAIKREISILREPVENMMTTESLGDSENRRNRKEERNVFSGASAEVNDNSWSVRTIVPHESESVEEEDQDQMATKG